jgi:hypothetical protein
MPPLEPESIHGGEDYYSWLWEPEEFELDPKIRYYQKRHTKDRRYYPGSAWALGATSK